MKTIVITTVLAALALPAAAGPMAAGATASPPAGVHEQRRRRPLPRSPLQLSQRAGTGQIQGQPMVAERGNGVERGRWAVGR